MDRTIFHCDLNSFYASVELLSHPELRDRPVAVCGDASTVTVHIKHIRDKIEVDPQHIQYIETVWGVGYRFRG